MNEAANQQIRLAQQLRSGKMISDSRRHRRYLNALQRAAAADADFIRALSALTADDRTWLTACGWQEPPHAHFIRLNGLDVDRL